MDQLQQNKVLNCYNVKMTQLKPKYITKTPRKEKSDYRLKFMNQRIWLISKSKFSFHHLPLRPAFCFCHLFNKGSEQANSTDKDIEAHKVSKIHWKSNLKTTKHLDYIITIKLSKRLLFSKCIAIHSSQRSVMIGRWTANINLNACTARQQVSRTLLKDV